MSVVVIDASAVVCAMLPHDKRSAAAGARIAAADLLQAPAVLDFEVIHVIRRLLLTDALMTEGRAGAMLDLLAELPIQRTPMDRVLASRTLAHRGNLSAYDASYVALAETIGATLVTADLRLANAPGIQCAVEAIA